MIVRVKLMGVLKAKTPDNDQIELADGATIEALLSALDIPPQSVQVFTVNGSLERDQGRVLADGDEISAIPPAGGG